MCFKSFYAIGLACGWPIIRRLALCAFFSIRAFLPVLIILYCNLIISTIF